MKIKSFIYWGLLSVLMWSCEQGYQPLTNSVYFGEAVNENLKKVTIEEDGAKTSVYVSLASPMDCDITAEIGVNPSVLDEYNKKHGTNYKLLPSNYYSLKDDQCVVKAGELSSSMLDININAFDNKLEPSEKYAIPVAILNASGTDVLAPSSTMVLLCDKVINTKVYFSRSFDTKYLVEEGDKLTEGMVDWTIEFLIYCESYASNKHILSFTDPSDRHAPSVFSRFGNLDHPINQFQFNVIQPIYAPTLFDKNKWYHVAVTCSNKVTIYVNGVADVTVDHPEPGSVFNFREFWIKRQNPGAICEMRIWNRVRTQAEIANNMYAVNPESEGLLTYWKIDDGGGNIVKDYAGNRDLKLPSGGTWKEQKFPPEK